MKESWHQCSLTGIHFRMLTLFYMNAPKLSVLAESYKQLNLSSSFKC